MTTILGLDASSTMIGYCLLQDGRALAHGHIKLPASNIAERCRVAQNELITLLEACPVDAVAIEAPMVYHGRYGAVIPQARVSGALLAIVSIRELAWLEIEPAKAKKAATGRGGASKDDVQRAAAEYGVHGEHAADALAIALAAVPSVLVEDEVLV